MFQLTAARRRLVKPCPMLFLHFQFQLTAARRRLDVWRYVIRGRLKVSTHSRPKAAGLEEARKLAFETVSTHSRPKAAGLLKPMPWLSLGFQLTAARRRLDGTLEAIAWKLVSTHSRPKAAGLGWQPAWFAEIVSTHSRPKAAGQMTRQDYDKLGVSTHSRPKAAGRFRDPTPAAQQSFNSQPPEGGWE